MTSDVPRDRVDHLLVPQPPDPIAERLHASTLSAVARQQLADAGLTEAEWARHCGWSDGVWHGDLCGCSDDRCIGYHHSRDEPCGCLPVLLDYLAPPGPLSGEWGGAKVVEP